MKSQSETSRRYYDSSLIRVHMTIRLLQSCLHAHAMTCGWGQGKLSDAQQCSNSSRRAQLNGRMPVRGCFFATACLLMFSLLSSLRCAASGVCSTGAKMVLMGTWLGILVVLVACGEERKKRACLCSRESRKSVYRRKM